MTTTTTTTSSLTRTAGMPAPARGGRGRRRRGGASSGSCCLHPPLLLLPAAILLLAAAATIPIVAGWSPRSASLGVRAVARPLAAAAPPSRRRGGGAGGGGSGGFGAGRPTRPSGGRRRHAGAPAPPPRAGDLLSPQAQALLLRHGGSVDAATEEYYRTRLAELLPTGGGGDGGADGEDAAHTARLRAAWDAVALFRPCEIAASGGRLDAFVERRLRFVAHACSPSGGGGDGASADGEDRGAPMRSWRVLDVGCGDGALVPYLLDRRSVGGGNAATAIDYVGLDVSPEMVALAVKRYGGEAATAGGWSTQSAPAFRVGSFPGDVSSSGDTYDCVLFNGSLQFFADPLRALRAARHCLRPPADDDPATPSSPLPRIVVAHVLGSKFVRRECQTNPTVALRAMPNVATDLQDIAREIGMRVQTKHDLIAEQRGGCQDGGTAAPPLPDWHDSDRSDDNFYLAALTL